jgi:hypothetical protein
VDPEVASYLAEMRDNGELRPVVGKRDSAAGQRFGARRRQQAPAYWRPPGTRLRQSRPSRR